MSDIKHEYTSAPICPYCGHEKRDSWELGDVQNGMDLECGSCGKEYLCIQHVVVEWTTEKKETS